MYASPTPRERALAALPALGMAGLLGWVLLFGLAWQRSAVPVDDLKLFEPAKERPRERERIVPARRHVHRRQGEAAPRGLRAVATEVVAPVPVVPPPVIPPVVVAPIADMGLAPSAGTSTLPGPGPGAGGFGNGRGSGGSGDGDGSGDDRDTPPRRIKGRITDRDWPEGAADRGAGGVVSVRYFVEVDGRASGCRITRSSGNADLDETTCRLIEQRFRYRPSLDADGRPVRSIMVVDHEWVNELGPPEPRRR